MSIIDDIKTLSPEIGEYMPLIQSLLSFVLGVIKDAIEMKSARDSGNAEKQAEIAARAEERYQQMKRDMVSFDSDLDANNALIDSEKPVA